MGSPSMNSGKFAFVYKRIQIFKNRVLFWCIVKIIGRYAETMHTHECRLQVHNLWSKFVFQSSKIRSIFLYFRIVQFDQKNLEMDMVFE